MFAPPLPQNPPTKPIVVCIDPGHPSEVGPGTRGKHVTEMEIAWKVALLLRSKLEKQHVTVVLTKSSEPEFVRNKRRAEIANAAHADIMVRLHCDAASGSGFTVYVPEKQGQYGSVLGPSRDLIAKSFPMAQRFHDTMETRLHGVLADNGLRGDQATAVGSRYGALVGSIFSKVPVVLIEMVVLTNPKDENFIAQPRNQDVVAGALTDATLAACHGTAPLHGSKESH